MEGYSAYEQELLKQIKNIEIGLKYYIKRNKELERELDNYKNAYENRVNEYILLEKRITALEEKDKDYAGLDAP